MRTGGFGQDCVGEVVIGYRFEKWPQSLILKTFDVDFDYEDIERTPRWRQEVNKTSYRNPISSRQEGLGCMKRGESKISLVNPEIGMTITCT